MDPRPSLDADLARLQAALSGPLAETLRVPAAIVLVCSIRRRLAAGLYDLAPVPAPSPTERSPR